MSVQQILIAVLTTVSTHLAPTRAPADQVMCSTLMDTTVMVSCNDHLAIPCHIMYIHACQSLHTDSALAT